MRGTSSSTLALPLVPTTHWIGESREQVLAGPLASFPGLPTFSTCGKPGNEASGSAYCTN